MAQVTGQIIKQLASRVVYESPYMRLREDQISRPDGSHGVYSYIDKPDFSLIIPAERGGFHLVEQYRYPVRARSWEFPQGTFPNGQTGSPEDLAREELRQETGLTAGDMRHIGHLHCGMGLTGQGFDVFVATDLTPGQQDLEIEEQDLIHRWMSRPDVEDMIRNGQITDDSTVAAYTLMLLADVDIS